ncbi:MAG: DNA polymerase IV [Mycoplasma sp.]|nr:DNA polymerase IV [Mycoplasma sp.]
MENRIFHLDMDCFFVSVETLFNPLIKAKPAIVAGRNKKGVVSSANYEARKFGIRSAMPVKIALKIYPNLIIANHHMDEYVKYSQNIYKLLSEKIKRVEESSIDEWFLDITGSEFESWKEHEFGSYLKNIIKQKFNLNCSVGCSYNKFFAKMATTLSKPDGFLIINKQNFKEKLYDLDVEKMTFVGKKTTDILKENGMNKIKDIASYSNDLYMYKKIGVSWIRIKNNALGIDDSPISNTNKRKMLGKSYTIEKFSEFKEFEILLKNIIEELKISIKNKYLYNSFTLRCKIKDSISFRKTVKYDEAKNDLNFEDAIFAFDEIIEPKYYPLIVNVSFYLNNIEELENNDEQLSFFNNKKELTKVDEIKNKVNSIFSKKILFTFND